MCPSVTVRSGGCQEDTRDVEGAREGTLVDARPSDDREVRAARNQSVFRAVNEKMRQLTSTLSSMAESQTIACECADMTCVDTLLIERAEYEAVRSEPHRFAVRAGHVLPDVERVVSENERFVVVEKLRTAAAVAAAHDPRGPGG